MFDTSLFPHNLSSSYYVITCIDELSCPCLRFAKLISVEVHLISIYQSKNKQQKSSTIFIFHFLKDLNRIGHISQLIYSAYPSVFITVVYHWNWSPNFLSFRYASCELRCHNKHLFYPIVRILLFIRARWLLSDEAKSRVGYYISKPG